MALPKILLVTVCLEELDRDSLNSSCSVRAGVSSIHKYSDKSVTQVLSASGCLFRDVRRRIVREFPKSIQWISTWIAVCLWVWWWLAGGWLELKVSTNQNTMLCYPTLLCPACQGQIAHGESWENFLQPFLSSWSGGAWDHHNLHSDSWDRYICNK